jgi:hypothetical protein
MDSSDGKILRRLARELVALREQENSATRAFPPRIWSEAATVAKRAGVGPVAKALKLDHSKLKRLVSNDEGGSGPATFFELLPLAGQADIGGCAVEVESSRGARMRIQIQSLTSSGLATLIREFVA